MDNKMKSGHEADFAYFAYHDIRFCFFSNTFETLVGQEIISKSGHEADFTYFAYRDIRFCFFFNTFETLGGQEIIFDNAHNICTVYSFLTPASFAVSKKKNLALMA